MLSAVGADAAFRRGFLRQSRPTVGTEGFVGCSGLTALLAYFHVFGGLICNAHHRVLNCSEKPSQSTCHLGGLPGLLHRALIALLRISLLLVLLLILLLGIALLIVLLLGIALRLVHSLACGLLHGLVEHLTKICAYSAAYGFLQLTIQKSHDHTSDL